MTRSPCRCAGLPAIEIFGGKDNDSIFGGSGNETLAGQAGDDLIDGNQGADVALLGAGNDTFVWDPGDGSDVVEGQAGTDTLRFNGANIAESFDLSANGSRLRLFRDIGNITMDVDGVETVDLNALGGADTITVNDLSATDVTAVNIDLAATGGGGDSQVDNVIVNGTGGNDNDGGKRSWIKPVSAGSRCLGLHRRRRTYRQVDHPAHWAATTRSMPHRCPRASHC